MKDENRLESMISYLIDARSICIEKSSIVSLCRRIHLKTVESGVWNEFRNLPVALSARMNQIFGSR